MPEIAPGFWVGIQFKDKCGKNDGTIGGVRYFACTTEHGGFVRPNRIELDAAAEAEEKEKAVAAAGSRAPSATSPSATTKPSSRGRFQPAVEEVVAEPTRVKSEAAPREVIETTSAPAAKKGQKLKMARDPASDAGKEKGLAPSARVGHDGKGASLSSQRDSAPSQRGGAPPASQRNVAKGQKGLNAMSSVREEESQVTSSPTATAAALTAAFEEHAMMRQTLEVAEVLSTAKKKRSPRGGGKKRSPRNKS